MAVAPPVFARPCSLCPSAPLLWRSVEISAAASHSSDPPLEGRINAVMVRPAIDSRYVALPATELGMVFDNAKAAETVGTTGMSNNSRSDLGIGFPNDPYA